MSKFVVVMCVFMVGFWGANAQLDTNYYADTCPDVTTIVQQVLERAAETDERIAAKLLRMHFHDCFVNGCDGSILLDGPNSEKVAPGNSGSVFGYDVIDDMKAAVESRCPGVVSCSDIVAVASEKSVEMTGGPSWEVPLGRLDSRTPHTEQIGNLVGFTEPVASMSEKFRNVGLNDTDLVALSGAHTIGNAQCLTFRHRLYNFSDGQPDTTLDPGYGDILRQTCPQSGNDTVRQDLDRQTPATFDNDYFINLQNRQGLLQTDQELFSNSTSDILAIVNDYAKNQGDFFANFVNSMIKMGNIMPTSGIDNLEVRRNCSVPNSAGFASA